jgi:site-specific DNA recombinase
MNKQFDAALIYCRVSSRKQEAEGSGKASQLHRCQQEADRLGMPVEAVFGDVQSAYGDVMDRPGMVGLIAHIKKNKGKRYVVIFDDLKRASRKTQAWLQFHETLKKLGAKPVCLNFKFEDTFEGWFTETVIAGAGELERHQQRRQAIQKSKARVEQGYYITHPPKGYRYERSKSDGALMVVDPAYAPIVRQALEGFASGRFGSVAEVVRFLETFPEWPRQKSGKRAGCVNETVVGEMLRHTAYAGLVSAPYWGVSLRPGRHEALISIETHRQILARLDGDKRSTARKDLSADFPLRGFVNCACGTPLTASWSRSKTGAQYAYYFCPGRACTAYGKSIPRAEIHADFETLLRSIPPSAATMRLVEPMFKLGWERRRRDTAGRVDAVRVQLTEVERQIETLVDRIVEAKTQTVADALEQRVEKLTMEKLALAEQIERGARGAAPVRNFEQAVRTPLRFLETPWKLWDSPRVEDRQKVLKLAFATKPQYERNLGFRTPNLSLPFMALKDETTLKNWMVGHTGESSNPAALLDTLAEWNKHLDQPERLAA